MMCFVKHQELISEAALLQTLSKWYKLLFSHAWVQQSLVFLFFFGGGGGKF